MNQNWSKKSIDLVSELIVAAAMDKSMVENQDYYALKLLNSINKTEKLGFHTEDAGTKSALVETVNKEPKPLEPCPTQKQVMFYHFQ